MQQVGVDVNLLLGGGGGGEGYELPVQDSFCLCIFSKREFASGCSLLRSWVLA